MSRVFVSAQEVAERAGVSRSAVSRTFTPGASVSPETRRKVLDRFPWAADLAPARLAVLVNMAFNLGITGLAAFSRTLAHVAAGQYAEASTEMLASLWAKQVGNRAKELSRQMRTGEWAEG